MKRKWVVFILAGILLFDLPAQVFGEEIDYLSFDMIEEEMMIRNPDILDNVNSYFESMSALDNEDTQDTSRYDQLKVDKEAFELNNDPMANDINGAISEIYAQLLRSLAPKSTSSSSSSGQSITKLVWNTEKSNYQIIWNAQKMYMTYHDLKRDLSIGNVKLAQLAYANRMTALKYTVGLATDKERLEAENVWTQQKKNIQSLEDQCNTMIQEFNLMFGQEADSALFIEAVPEASLQDISEINVDQDYEQAILKSYDVQIVELDGEERANETARREFKNAFYQIYEDLQDTVEEYQYAQKQAEYAQIDYENAKKRLGFGLIKQSDFISADYSLNSEIVKTQTVKDGLYRAYMRYEWAKRGLIFN